MTARELINHIEDLIDEELHDPSVFNVKIWQEDAWGGKEVDLRKEDVYTYGKDGAKILFVGRLVP